MKKHLLATMFLATGLGTYCQAQQTEKINPEWFFPIEHKQKANEPHIKEMVNTIAIGPQANCADSAKSRRQALRKMTEMQRPYRPSEIVTKSETGEDYMKYIYVYDNKGTFHSKGQSMVRIYQQWNKVDNVWDNNTRFKLIIDGNGDISGAYTDKGFKTQWDNYYHITYTYDNNHNQLTASQERWVDNEWYSTLRWENEYDNNGNITSQTYQNRAVDGDWQNGSRMTWTYDEAGRVLVKATQHWSTVSNKYSDYLKNEYEYDDKGNLVAEQQTNPGAVIRKEHSYDTNNNMLETTEKRWQNEDWINTNHTMFEYDSQNRTTCATTSRWTGTKDDGSWVFTAKTTTEYTDNSKAQTNYRYDTAASEWVGSIRYTETVDGRGLPLKNLNEGWSIVDGTGQWVVNAQDTYDYNAGGDLTLMKSEANAGGNFVPTSYFEFEYDEIHNGSKVMASRKQAREWIYIPYHNMADEWASPDYESWIADATYIDLRQYVNATGVSLDKSEQKVETELNFRLTASVLPANASNKEVEWSSSDESVAIVSVDGKVYGIAPGTATITARTLDGSHTASCTVTVADDLTSIDGIKDRATVTYSNGTISIHGEGIKSVTVTDIAGRTVSKSAAAGDISTASWPKGMYIVKVANGHKNSTNKIIVE